MEYIDERSLAELGASKSQAPTRKTVEPTLAKARETAKKAADEAAAKRKEAMDKAAKEAKAQAAALKAKAMEAKEAVVDKTKDVVKQGEDLVSKVETKVVDAAKGATAAVKSAESKAAAAVHRAEDKVSASTQPVSTSPVSPDAQPPRKLDATPQSIGKPDTQSWTEPLPIGFEAPPGYNAQKAKARDVVPRPANEPVLIAPRFPPPARPEPLPLVAPTVSSLTASEPALGQLASTIDSLTKALTSDRQEVGTPTSQLNQPAKDVLAKAEADIKSLAERVEAVKAAEHDKLQKSLDSQRSEYAGQLEQKEKELFDRLASQEEDWKSAFDVERNQLVAAYRAKLDSELTTQKELINARLKEELIAQGIDMQRKWLSDIKTKVEEERGGRLARLNELHDGIKNLAKVTIDNDSYLTESLSVNTLWSAVRAADDAEGRPMLDELTALKELASKQAQAEGKGTAKEVMTAALSSIPTDVAATGIQPLSTLSAWFTTKLVPRIKLAALMPDNGGALAYAASSMLSPLLFSRQGPAEGDDVMSVLSRADWFLSQKDLDSAAREINQLKVRLKAHRLTSRKADDIAFQGLA